MRRDVDVVKSDGETEAGVGVGGFSAADAPSPSI